ncbi:hypothetical protein [Flectobacillus sp.]|uniref:hypothetical protein n=1 Tax=Flectobacillus sp. TaxID=50419 RepID=UPI003BAA81F5
MRILFTFLLTCFIISTITAQSKYDKAILIQNTLASDPYISTIVNTVNSKLKQNPSRHLYWWGVDDHKLSLLNSSEVISKPIDKVKYIVFNLTGFDQTPVLQMTTDTTGKTLSVFYTINPFFQFKTKDIEVKSSKILDISNVSIDTRFSLIGTKIEVKKFAEEFGADPNKLKKSDPKQYDKMLQKVNQKYKPIIADKLKEWCVYFGTETARSLNFFPGEYSDRSFKVIPDPADSDKKRVKQISFNGSLKDGIQKNEFFELYEILDFDAKKTTRYVGSFSVSEVGENQSTAEKFGIGGGKDIAEVLKSGNEVLLFDGRNSALKYIKGMNKNLTEYNVGIRKECLFCANALEKTLISIPVINTIERNAPELTYFQELAKSDNYFDFNNEALLNKQLGVKYLFYKDAENLMVTDIETGRIIGSESSFSNVDKTIAKNIFLDVSQKSMEFLKVKEANKKKVKEIYLYSDFGFSYGERVSIFIKEEEKVGNKVLQRKVAIAEGKVTEIISDFICELTIKEGEKELLEALNANKQINIEYKIK